MFEKDTDIQVAAVLIHIPITITKMEEIQLDTLADPTMQTLKIYIIHGWPPMHYNHETELLVQQNLILKGKCVVIPLDLRTQILDHQDQEKCK